MWGGRGGGWRLFSAACGLLHACWSVRGCGANAKGAEFGGAGGASATVRSLAFCASAFCSRHQSPHAVSSCARFWWLISAAQGVPFGMTKRFLPCRRCGGWPPNQHSALLDLSSHVPRWARLARWSSHRRTGGCSYLNTAPVITNTVQLACRAGFCDDCVCVESCVLLSLSFSARSGSRQIAACRRPLWHEMCAADNVCPERLMWPSPQPSPHPFYLSSCLLRARRRVRCETSASDELMVEVEARAGRALRRPRRRIQVQMYKTTILS